MTKEEMKDYSKEYRLKNPDKEKEHQRKYYLKHKEQKNERMKKQYLKNKDKIKERQEKYRLKNKDKIKEYNLIRNYNVTQEQYEQMVISQDGKCAICGKEETRINNKSGKIQNLSVDHDHKTGKVRQLLCNICNNVLGRINDDPDIAIKLARYLYKWR